MSEVIKQYQELLAFLAGIVVVMGGYYAYLQNAPAPPVVTEEWHTHNDFLVYVNDKQIRFTDKKYQTDATNILHEDYHFHDFEDHVIHRHAEDLTLVEFMDSLGFTLTNDCLTTDTAEIYCTEGERVLRLYVNDKILVDIENYVPADGDQTLLYFGNAENPAIETYLSEITDEACIYTGTCPERGIAPPESCGITCEL